MKKYDEYKNVQMGWLNKIPIHWTTISLKFSTGNKPLSFVDGDWIESKVIKSDGIRYLTTGNVGVISYKEQGNGFISEQTFKELNCTEVFSGDILISRLNFPIGRACIVPDLGYRIVVAVDNVIFRPDTTKYNRRYLVYQMNCYPYSENANVLGRGSTMQRITRTQLGAFKLCVPPLPEQVAIATYLDTHCAKIDNLISIQQKRIALLQELKQSVITHAVTKGLNPNVEMKQSGVEWIGDVPKHWEVRRLKYITYMQSGETISPNDFNDDGKYPVFGGNGFRGYTDRYTNEGRHVLIGRQGALCGNINYASGRFYASEHAIVVYPLHDEDITWIGESMRACDFNRYSQTAAQPGIAVNNIKNIIFPYPSLQEQKQIAAYLNHKCATIDTSISNAQHQIDLLQEYKQSLITEVVTGKRKVTDN